MKVLFVVSGNKNNQPSTVVKNQADSLIESGVDVDFYLIKGRGVSGYMKNIIPLMKKIRSGDYEVVHSHYSLTALISTLALFIIGRTPHVVSLMGSDAQRKGILKLLVKLFSRKYWSATIVKSEKMLLDSGIFKANIIPNGVEIKKIVQIQKKLGDLSQVKNKKSEFVVLFAADPSRESKNYFLAEQSMKNIQAKLRVIYNLPHKDILVELLMADVVLSTSLWEGSPNLIKETMACNRPIVATDVGDIRWLFGNQSGHFITSFEPSDVAAKIRKALDFAANKESTRGRDRILSLGLDSETVAKRIVQVYQSVLKK